MSNPSKGPRELCKGLDATVAVRLRGGLKRPVRVPRAGGKSFGNNAEGEFGGDAEVGLLK